MSEPTPTPQQAALASARAAAELTEQLIREHMKAVEGVMRSAMESAAESKRAAREGVAAAMRELEALRQRNVAGPAQPTAEDEKR